MSRERASIWTESVKIQQREPLKENIAVDIAVIGGGLAGLLTAYFLQQEGKEVVVLEADRIGSGQTGRTTAKITLQHGLCYQKLIEKVGKGAAADYMHCGRLAVETYRELIQKNRISCEFRECDAVLYSRTNTELLEAEARAIKSLGIDAELSAQTELPFPVRTALSIGGQACFHPLLFLERLAEGLTVYEKTKALGIKKGAVITDRGRVEAGRIVFACHYPFVNRPGYYFLRMHQERSYVAALTGTPPVRNLYYGIDAQGLSFRQSGEYLLLGDAGHRTGENTQGGQYELLKEQAQRLYPQGKLAALWSAQDCMPLDSIPYIGQFSHSTPNIYVATGFKKWGMTNAMTAALILRDMIIWGECSFGKVFSPERFHWKASAHSLWNEGSHAVRGLSKGFLGLPGEILEQIPPNHGEIVEYEGKAAGVFKEENGTCHVVDAQCSHLGCRLAWNPEELTWDCPCHGSRFTYDGELIDNPAGKDLG